MQRCESWPEFLESPEKISTNILSNRLNLLEEQGLITATNKSLRTGKAIYLLTDKGERLYLVLEAIAAWALENIESTQKLVVLNEQWKSIEYERPDLVSY